ncbi:PAS domain-containing sensor histidine kinase [Desulfococcus sp.]|uniref:sensor histidine kinase n=1 Tax=Desulfococcus sp. TaxID=2025834 RepID=UPI003592EDBF
MVPVWRVSLLLFGVLISIVLAYFYWQARQVQQTFLSHSLEHAGMLANVIEQNARTAVLSQEAVEKIVQVFLGNTGRFVAYLEAVEPFSADELAEFARESGLAGIRLRRADGTETHGPEDSGIPAAVDCLKGAGEILHFSDKNLYVSVAPLLDGKGCVVTGLESVLIGRLNEEISLHRLLGSLTGMAGIRYVRVEKKALPARGSADDDEIDLSGIRIINLGGEAIAESRIPFGDGLLVAGMDTSYFLSRTRQIWFEFSFFAGVLALLGISFSWIHHRVQTRYLRHIRAVERGVADHREDAALGRAAAVIAHEIRNPLNAISMGLQRLQIEASELSGEYRDLVATLLQAVRRTNTIVRDLRKYARPAAPAFKSISPAAVVGEILDLYRPKCAEQSITILEEISYPGEIHADPQMMAQLAENLVKNGVEAQPDGGYLRVCLDLRDGDVILSFENKEFHLPPSETLHLAAPYFTTKARGTGLGLSIVQRIVHAHRGRLIFTVPEAGVLRVDVRLPLTQETKKQNHEHSDR